MRMVPASRSTSDHCKPSSSPAAPTVEGRERVMQQLNRRVHEHPRYQRLPQRAQMFLAGYIHRCLDERFGVSDAQDEQSS